MKGKKILLGFLAVLFFGLSSFTLASCGEQPHVHEWNEIERTNATCTEDGIITYLCIDCEEIKNVVIETAKGHNYVNDICGDCGQINESYYTEGLAFDLSSDRTFYSVSVGTAIDTTDIIIPSIYKGLPVTSIDDWAFSFCYSLTNISIPDSVTSIGNYAFCNCDSLTNISIPDSVTSIGNYAFWDCSSLTSISIPDSVTSIGEGAFSWCTALPNIIIPDSVTSIGDWAFNDCSSLGRVIIGNSVTSIGKSAFEDCSSLGIVTIGNSVTSIGNYAFYDCSSLKTVYYKGTKEQWKRITKGSNNTRLTDATIIYNYEG